MTNCHRCYVGNLKKKNVSMESESDKMRKEEMLIRDELRQGRVDRH